MPSQVRPTTTLSDVLKLAKEDIFSSLRCMMIGEIVSFDGVKKTASVRVLFKRVLPNNTVQSYPLLVDCPVFTPQGGGAALQLPIVPGDQCLVFFADRNIDSWFKTGAEGAPFDGRCHDMSDGVALVGVNSLVSGLGDYENGVAKLSFMGAQVRLVGGLIVLQNETIDILTILTALFAALEAMQVVGNLALTPASIAALELVKAQFLTLFGAAS